MQLHGNFDAELAHLRSADLREGADCGRRASSKRRRSTRRPLPDRTD